MANRILTKQEFSQSIAEGLFDSLIESGFAVADIKDMFNPASWEWLMQRESQKNQVVAG